MKKTLTLLICLICYQILCHAQVAGGHYYFKNLGEWIIAEYSKYNFTG